MKNSVIQTGGNLHLEGTRIMYLDSRKFPEFNPIDIPKKTIIFQFEDGKQATFRLDKDCDSMQAFLNRVEKYHELEKENKRLQEQINEANTVICGLYHLTTDKKAASGVVCDYLVKYGKPFEAESVV